MDKKQLMPITQQIVETLEQNEIEEFEYVTVLKNVLTEIQNNIEIKIDIEEQYFNLLKDMIWYNLEKTEADETLENYGSKYPVFMTLCDNDNTINRDAYFGLNKELEEIKSKLSTFKIASLIGNEELFDLQAKLYKKGEKRKDCIECKVTTDLMSDEMTRIKVESVINAILSAVEKADNKKARVLISFI